MVDTNTLENIVEIGKEAGALLLKVELFCYVMKYAGVIPYYRRFFRERCEEIKGTPDEAMLKARMDHTLSVLPKYFLLPFPLDFHYFYNNIRDYDSRHDCI